MFDRKAYNREWNRAHKEQINARNREYYAKHKEAIKKRKHEYYLKQKLNYFKKYLIEEEQKNETV